MGFFVCVMMIEPKMLLGAVKVIENGMLFCAVTVIEQCCLGAMIIEHRILFNFCAMIIEHENGLFFCV